MVDCTWIWLGFTVRWAHDPTSPMCPAGSTCNPPAQDGTYFGEPGVTGCEVI